MSEETYVMGRSFKIASISVMIVCSPAKLMYVRPRTFFKVVLVKPIRRSQKPPNQGALLGMNCHSTPRLLRESCSDGEWKSDLSSSAAERNMDALSEIIFFGWDLKICEMH